MSEALQEYFAESRGIRSAKEVTGWIRKHYRNRWKPGTLRDHLYGGQVNNPKAYQHHPYQRKFLFGLEDGRYERYSPDKHGYFRDGFKVRTADTPSWILIHSEKRYKDAKPDNPEDELALFWPRRSWDRLWHCKRKAPLREDTRPRAILLAWKGAVFGEATATVTRDIGNADRSESNFAFRLLEYRPLRTPVPLSALKLGPHRDLVSLTPEILRIYRAATRGQVRRSKYRDISETEQNEESVEVGVNPHHSRQGFGLTAAEKRCVELHAMGIAESYLNGEGYQTKNVSKGNPFDLLARRKGETLHVEVKGTTGGGKEILLTRKEVRFQRMKHPANMLFVVHSISLTRETEPSASGGTPRVISPWLLTGKQLKPYAFAYEV
jgi:hypothetical protein